MDIEKMREKLAIEISQSEEWVDKLNDSNPGHYGVEDWDVVISNDNIWVDIPQRSFTFKGVTFDFTVQIGSSNKDDGSEMSFSKIASGQGVFEFKDDDITIEELNLQFDLDLFAD